MIEFKNAYFNITGGIAKLADNEILNLEKTLSLFTDNFESYKFDGVNTDSLNFEHQIHKSHNDHYIFEIVLRRDFSSEMQKHNSHYGVKIQYDANPFTLYEHFSSKFENGEVEQWKNEIMNSDAFQKAAKEKYKFVEVLLEK